MIEDSLGKRKHVVHYNDKIIPTKSEVEETYGTTTESKNYVANSGLFHIKSAPWTFIVTPRTSSPNPHYRWWYDTTGSKWQLDDWEFVNTRNRETTGIDVGMVATAIAGAAFDRGWDVSYNICFYKMILNLIPILHLKIYLIFLMRKIYEH